MVSAHAVRCVGDYVVDRREDSIRPRLGRENANGDINDACGSWV